MSACLRRQMLFWENEVLVVVLSSWLPQILLFFCMLMFNVMVSMDPFFLMSFFRQCVVQLLVAPTLFSFSLPLTKSPLSPQQSQQLGHTKGHLGSSNINWPKSPSLSYDPLFPPYIPFQIAFRFCQFSIQVLKGFRRWPQKEVSPCISK